MEGKHLNIQRAEEISQSGDMKRVTYNGKAVYIQRVDEQNETARVFHLEEPQKEFDVKLSQLEEQ